jgi:hypothetical protein
VLSIVLIAMGTSLGRACTGTSRRAAQARSTGSPAVQQQAQHPSPVPEALQLDLQPPAVPNAPTMMVAVAQNSAMVSATGVSRAAVLDDPIASGLITEVPGMAAPGDVPPAWQERTQLARYRPGSGAPSTGRSPETVTGWMIILDDGRTVPLDGAAVFGRDPAALPGENGISLLAVPDETRTVSKTHVKLEPGADAVLVTDRHSTNGVVVITAGVATRCRAGEPMVATSGSVVRFGDREMQVRRQ